MRNGEDFGNFDRARITREMTVQELRDTDSPSEECSLRELLGRPGGGRDEGDFTCSSGSGGCLILAPKDYDQGRDPGLQKADRLLPLPQPYPDEEIMAYPSTRG
jgi:hypothetical protein